MSLEFHEYLTIEDCAMATILDLSNVRDNLNLIIRSLVCASTDEVLTEVEHRNVLRVAEDIRESLLSIEFNRIAIQSCFDVLNIQETLTDQLMVKE